jgi:hypothetical protein
MKKVTDMEYESGLERIEEMAIEDRIIIWVLDSTKKFQERDIFRKLEPLSLLDNRSQDSTV